jgi:hypothetical protein
MGGEGYGRYSLDDPSCGGCDGTEGVDVGHHIMPPLFLLRCSDVELLGGEMLTS